MLLAVERGMPRKEVVEVFDVSLATIKRWLKRRHETRDVETGPLPGRPPMKGAALREWLPAQLSANPTLTLAERYEAAQGAAGQPARLDRKAPCWQSGTSSPLTQAAVGTRHPRVGHRAELLCRIAACTKIPLKWRISVQGPRCL